MANPDDSQLFSKVLNTVRASTALAAQDVDFYRSMSSDIGGSLDETSVKIVGLINGLVTSVDQHADQIGSGRDRLDESWKEFSNLMDNLFELSDRSLDILTKSPAGVNNAANLQFLDDSSRSKDLTPTKIVKPQLSFKNAIDNTESHPFIPLLKEKPFALQPFEGPILIPADDFVPEHYEHPYQGEIEHQEYDDTVVVKSKPIPSQPWDTTEAKWIDNIEALGAMVSDLSGVTEIAVDLEHHDYRSYYGIVCLMQISTREKDYLVDTISLRDELQVLNKVFANPKILKVFHGAFMDIIWLQRDLGLYVVGLFDTYHASRAIGLPRHSLAYLLERYANFKTSKKYQLADWRIRPLSKPMNSYARADTHFLLNIYDQLRNTLIEQGKLAGVLAESRNVAKRRFEYSRYRPVVPSSSVYCLIEKPEPWKLLMSQYNIPSEKEDLVQKLYDWRDKVARRSDESPRYVMPNQLLVSLAVHGPTTPVDVISVNNIVTDYVRSNSLILANLIKSSLELIKNGRESHSENINKSTPDFSLTVPQIKKVMANFKSICRSVSVPRQQLQNGSQAKLTNILTSENNAVEYKNDAVQHVENSSFQLRYRGASQAMEEFDNTVAYCMPIPQTNIEETAATPFRASQEDTQQPVGQTEENMDEVVTLKKAVKHSKLPKADAEKTSREVIDYSKSDKILGSNRAQDKKDAKKRGFDPYSASNHSEGAPRGVKKRKSTNRGRNVSFKK